MGGLFFLPAFGRLSQFSACYIFCYFAVNFYQAIRRVPELQRAPYNPVIYPSHLFNVGLVSWIAIYLGSVFVGFIAAMGSKGEDLPKLEIAMGLFDLVHAFFMLLSARIQGSYLPDFSGPNNCTGATTWGVPDGEPSLFTLISISMDGNTTESGACDQCYTYQAAWLYERIMGFVAIGTGILCLIYPAYKLVLAPRIYFLARKFKKQRQFRLTKYTAESVLACGQKENPMLQPISFPEDETQPTLRRLVSIDPILSTIATYSHYTDLKSLEATCKSIKNAMRCCTSETLRRESCIDGTKTECWACMTQICEACHISRSIIQTDTTAHLENCQPYCSKCHFKRHYHPQSYYAYWSKKHCECRAPQTYYWRTPAPKTLLCQQCNALPVTEVQMMREKREKLEMAHLLQWPLRCAGCKKHIPEKSLCWWGCSKCSLVCMADFHPSFSPQAEEV